MSDDEAFFSIPKTVYGFLVACFAEVVAKY